MLENSELAIVGHRVALVPYRPEHVPTYHKWMQDSALLEATASEKLTLEQEYENCESWKTSKDKLTFIILNRLAPGAPMVGDVNVFLSKLRGEFEDEEGLIGDAHDAAETAPSDQSGEVEVMIAEPSARRLGLAAEAMRLMIGYVVNTLGLRHLTAKVGMDNKASLAFFARHFPKFVEESRSDAFKEITFVWEINMVDMLNISSSTAHAVNRYALPTSHPLSVAPVWKRAPEDETPVGLLSTGLLSAKVYRYRSGKAPRRGRVDRAELRAAGPPPETPVGAPTWYPTPKPPGGADEEEESGGPILAFTPEQIAAMKEASAAQPDPDSWTQTQNDMLNAKLLGSFLARVPSMNIDNPGVVYGGSPDDEEEEEDGFKDD